ncbi:GAF domain-containing protein [Pseudonocardia ailaonensis]
MGLTLQVGRTAVAGADPRTLLSSICAALPTTLGVSGAAIVLVEPPDRAIAGVSASDTAAIRLGEMELRAGTGPVQGAVRSGRPMVTPDLTRIGPPELAAAAADTGLTCSVVVPLFVDGEPAGGLQLFGHPGRPVGEGHVDAVAGLAEALSARLGDICALRRLTATVARLTAEHEAAVPVEQATGMLAERYRTDVEEAGRYLHSRAATAGRSLAEAAAEILDRRDDEAAAPDPAHPSAIDPPTEAFGAVPQQRRGPAPAARNGSGPDSGGGHPGRAPFGGPSLPNGRGPATPPAVDGRAVARTPGSNVGAPSSAAHSRDSAATPRAAHGGPASPAPTGRAARSVGGAVEGAVGGEVDGVSATAAVTQRSTTGSIPGGHRRSRGGTPARELLADHSASARPGRRRAAEQAGERRPHGTSTGTSTGNSAASDHDPDSGPAAGRDRSLNGSLAAGSVLPGSGSDRGLAGPDLPAGGHGRSAAAASDRGPVSGADRGSGRAVGAPEIPAPRQGGRRRLREDHPSQTGGPAPSADDRWNATPDLPGSPRPSSPASGSHRSAPQGRGSQHRSPGSAAGPMDRSAGSGSRARPGHAARADRSLGSTSGDRRRAPAQDPMVVGRDPWELDQFEQFDPSDRAARQAPPRGPNGPGPDGPPRHRRP